MSNSASKRYLLSPVALAALAFVAGCGEETDETVAAVVDPDPAATIIPLASYSAPGSNWEFDLHDDGSYEVSRSARRGMSSDLTVGGSYQATSTGFLSMTVDASTGTDAPATGTSIWGLEVPGYALLLSPVSTSDDNFVPMVGGDECPATDLGNNWITVRADLNGDATSSTGSYFGSLSHKHNDGTTNFETQFALTAGNPDQGTMYLGNGYCQNGVVNSSTSDIYLSTSGSAAVHANVSDADGGQVVFSLPKTTVGSIAGLDGSYAGILSDAGTDSGPKVSPVIVTCVSGLCTGDFVSDIGAGTLAGQTFTVDLSGSINVPTPGFTTGQLHLNGSDSNLACMVDENLDDFGRRMISCAGQSPTRNYSLFNLILASND